VLVGSNTAWCHPVVYQRIMAARAARGTKVVVIDPRRTETCEEADLHLALRPGSDVALMNGLLAYCSDNGIVDPDFLEGHVATPDRFWEALGEGCDLWSTAAACDLPPSDLLRSTSCSRGTSARSRCSARGSTSRSAAPTRSTRSSTSTSPPGASASPARRRSRSPGSPTRWAGARSAGSPRRSPRTWISRRERRRRQALLGRAAMAEKPGLKAVDLFRQMREGRVKALWVMATNPAVSLPDASSCARRWRCARSWSSRLHRRDRHLAPRARQAARARLGREGRHGHQQRAHDQPPARAAAGAGRGEARLVDRQDQVARAMGWRDAFTYDRPADIYREHARLSAYRNDGKRLFDIGSHAALTNVQYDAMEPVRWGGTPFADGRFSTPDGKARLVAVEQRRSTARCPSGR
jgi:assimilatory nitrate reductase catalytic subunit